MTHPRVVIAGGGLAAVRTAQSLRDLGHGGEIVLLSAEQEVPYDRPPLSKDYLLGKTDDEALRLLTDTELTELTARLKLGARVVALDTSIHAVTLADGLSVPYDKLVIATGARARALPLLRGRPGALALRTAEDSRRLGRVVAEGRPIAVVGGGFIGLEVAATARTRGCAVTVVEAQEAPLLGAVGPLAAAWLRERHEDRGVTFRCGTIVTGVDDAPGGGERLHLSDGTTLDADAVVVGVGVERDVAWMAAAGLETADGLVCDRDGRTNLPDVFGAGDVVCHRNERGTVPIGHWTAAGESARRAAHAVLDLEPPPLTDDAFFWSDQFDLRLQSVGHAGADAEFTVVDGEMDAGSFVAHYVRDGRTTGVLAVNNPRGFLKNRLALRKARAATAGVAG